MQIAVQDPEKHTTYILDPSSLADFELSNAQSGDGADIVFVLPSQTLCDQVPVVPGAGSGDQSILISDPDSDRRWLLTRSDLERFAAPTSSAANEAVWFSMPGTAAGIYTAVPLFRRALVQNSS
ncbi:MULTISPECIES: hypothetical protein [unclassified Kitasatospora]|uniref:hypothetical protein n=1 Tax=unclassified Kitasatospora TaxID=2633591 RepID=UPI0037FF6593